MERLGKTTRQAIAYVAVGGGTALLELVVFQGLYALSPLGVVGSNVIAVIIATICNFVLNGTTTFKTCSNWIRSAILYTLLFLFNTTFSTLTIGWLINAGAPSLMAKLSTMICIVVWNFFLYKKVVFI